MLVTAATGILAPAVSTLLDRGDQVYALARGAGAVPHVVPVIADLTDGPVAQRALRPLPRLDAALLYAPFAATAVWRLLAEAVDGPVVDVFTSRWADPERGSAELGDLPAVGIPLLLGWAYGPDGPDGPARWHTPAEVSAAALEVLDSGEPAQLGAVRPWGDRPQ